MTFNIGDQVQFRIDPFHHPMTGRVVGVCTYRGTPVVDVEVDGTRHNNVTGVALVKEGGE